MAGATVFTIAVAPFSTRAYTLNALRRNLSGGTITAHRAINAGHRAWAKIHQATIFTKGTKNAIVHHLFSPTRPRILDIGMALSTRITTRMIHCHNGCMSNSRFQCERGHDFIIVFMTKRPRAQRLSTLQHDSVCRGAGFRRLPNAIAYRTRT
jgi:hypothetical protein